MKKLFLFICFFLMLNFSQAQIKKAAITYLKNQPTRDSLNKFFVRPGTYPIIYDFRSGEILPPLKKIRVHTPVIFVVNNINPFAYDIKITPKDSVLAPSSFDFEINEWISKTVIENAQNQLEKEQSIQEQKTKQIEPMVETDVQNSAKLPEIAKSLKANEEIRILEAREKVLTDSISQLLNPVADPAIQDTSLKPTPEDTVTKKETINEKLMLDEEKPVEIKPQIQVIDNGKIKNLNGKIGEVQAAIAVNKKRVIPDLQHFLQLYNKFRTAYDRYMIDCQIVFGIVRNAKLVSMIAEDPNLSEHVYNTTYRESFEKAILEIRENRHAVNQYKKSFSELINTYALLNYDPTLLDFFTTSGIEKLYAYPKYIKEKSDALYDRILQLPIENYMKQSEWIGTQLLKENPFTYRSIPIQPVNDLIEFKIDITKRNKLMPSSHYNEMSFVYHQPVYGGTRVDFSLGLALSYFPKTPTYEIGFRTPSDTSSLTIFQKSNDLIAPSLVGLVTMSHRKTRYVAYGVSAGLGIDVLNGKVQLSNFFMGPSVLFGKFDRLLLTGGGSVRNVQRLASGYFVDSEVGRSTEISSVLKDKYKIGFFLGVTYSLTNNAKKMMKSFK